MADRESRPETTASSGSPPSFACDAFISYRRADGAPYANHLRQHLVDYRMPKTFPQRRLNIYLDTVYEHATEDFFERTIRPALTSSKALIVVQTPESVSLTESGEENWVVREIRHFRTLPQGNNISIALAIGDFGDPLPADLALEFPRIERVDIRTLGEKRPKISEHELLKFVGLLHDVPLSRMPDLRRDAEVRARSRRIRLATIGGAIAVVLALLAGFASFQWRRAETELARQASLRLAAEASRVPAGELDLAHLLASQAYRISPTAEAARALMDVGSREPRLLRYFHCPAGRMAYAVKVLPAARAVAVACTAQVLLFGLDDGRLLRSQPLSEDARVMEVIPGLKLEQLLLGGAKELRVVVTNHDIVSITGHSAAITAIRLSPDGTFLLTGDSAGIVRRWSIAPDPRGWGSEQLGRIEGSVSAIEFENGLMGATASDGHFWLLDTTTRSFRKTPVSIAAPFVPACEQKPAFRYASPLVENEDEHLQAYVDEGNEVVVSLRDDCFLLHGNTHNISALTFAKDGQRLLLASAGQIGKQRHGAIVWNLSQQHPFTTSLLPPSPSLFASPALASSDMLAAISIRGEPLHIWRIADKWTKIAAPEVNASTLALSHNDDELTVVDTNQAIRRFRIEKAQLREISAPRLKGRSVAYTRDGTLVVLTDDALWQVSRSGQAVSLPMPALADAPCTKLTRDATLLLVEANGKLSTFDVHTRRASEIALPAQPPGASCAGLDGLQEHRLVARVLNTYAPDPVQLFDLKKKNLLQTFQSPFSMHSGLPATLQEPLLSSNGRLAVVSRGDETSILVWDLEASTLLGALPLGRNLNGWTMSESGERVLASTNSGTIIWNLSPGLWAEEANRIANRPFTEAETRAYGTKTR